MDLPRNRRIAHRAAQRLVDEIRPLKSLSSRELLGRAERVIRDALAAAPRPPFPPPFSRN